MPHGTFVRNRGKKSTTTINMSSATTAPEPFKATVSQKFLSKVDRVFNASLETIFNELLQNSRRAGATEVTLYVIRHEDAQHVTLRYMDNGSGVKNPLVLLQLSDSEWDSATQELEDPAGMGFFSLSNHTVKVSSGDWSATITPEHFRGEDFVTPVESEATVDGVRIEWDWTLQENGYHSYDWRCLELCRSFYLCSKFSELEKITIVDRDGASNEMERKPDQVHQFIPPRFMSHLCRLGDTQYDEELGVTFGWGQTDELEGKLEGVFLPDSNKTRCGSVIVNFHGLLISLPYSDDEFPLIEKIARNLRTNARTTSDASCRIYIDVHHSKALKLVLPARDQIKQDDRYHEVLQKMENFMGQLVSRHHFGAHTLPFQAFQELASRGIDIGEAMPMLEKAESHWQKHTVAPGDYRIGIGYQGIYEEFQSYYHQDLPPFRDLFRSNREYRGYSWYDRMPVVNKVFFKVNGKTVADDDVAALIDVLPDDDDFAGGVVEVDDLVIALEMSELGQDGEVQTITHEYPADFAVISDSLGESTASALFDGDSAAILLPKGHSLKGKSGRGSVNHIAYRIAEWKYDPDTDYPETHTQQLFAADVERMLWEHLGEPGYGQKVTFMQTLNSSGLEYAGSGLRWQLSARTIETSLGYKGTDMTSLIYTEEEALTHRKLAFVIRANGDTKPYEFYAAHPIDRDDVAKFLEEGNVYCPKEDKLYVHNIVDPIGIRRAEDV